jgi:hypothetical protein
MAHKVKRVQTSASEDQVVSAITQSWAEVFGGRPTLSQVGKTWAQIALETGRAKIMFNNNVGNINWTPGFNGNYYEITDSYTIGNNPANRQKYRSKMRSYHSLFDGVKDYLTFLKNRGPVSDALQKGSPKDFSYALAAAHYYDPYIRDDYKNNTGKKVNGYTSGLTAIYQQFIEKRKGEPPSVPEESRKPESGLLASFLKGLSSLLDSLTAVASEGSIKMKSISKYGSDYPQNRYLISVDSNDDFSSKLEFARILSLALKEEIDSDSEIFTDGKDVEIQCVVNAERVRGLEVVKELCATLSDVFEDATKKIGGVKTYTFVMANENSYYQKLDIKLSENNYKKFHLKFAK